MYTIVMYTIVILLGAIPASINMRTVVCRHGQPLPLNYTKIHYIDYSQHYLAA